MIDYIIATSAVRHCIITIIYFNGKKITQRNIKVIDYDDNNIKAFCYLRNQIRCFKRSDILSAAFYKPHGVKTDRIDYVS